MKDGFKEIIGKQIASVVVAENDKRAPRNQAFLVFTDGTCLELYGESFTCCAGIDKVAAIDFTVRGAGGRIVRVYDRPVEVARVVTKALGTYSPSPPYFVNSTEEMGALMWRDMAAWVATKEAIARAKG